MTSDSQQAYVLVVDDTADNAYLLCQILGLSGYRTSVAADGASALAQIAHQPPDMILLDVMMPGMDGYEVTRQIRADARLPFIPIILITAKSTMSDKLEGLASGADDFLAKPVNRAELLARVQALLRLKYTQDALRAEQQKTALLLRLGQQLATSLDLDQVLSMALELMMTTFGASAGHLLLFDEQSQPWQSIAVPGQPSAGVTGIAILEGMTLPDGAGLLNDGAAIVTTLRYQGRRLGLVAMVHEQPGGFRVEQLDLLAGVADQVSLALFNARLYTRLRDAEAAREQMLNLLAHDMRTPLAGVISCLELLERTAAAAGYDRELIDMALDAGRYQDGMIADLLDLHRADSAGLVLTFAPTDLLALMASVGAALGPRLRQKQLNVRAEIPPDLYALADHEKLGRVLTNLLRHALKYSPYGGTIRVRGEADGHGQAHLVVEDDGVAAADLDAIFDRFYQSGAAHTGRRGAGIGLAFCQAIVGLHGGRLWAESDGERGMRFCLTLPIAATDGAHL